MDMVRRLAVAGALAVALLSLGSTAAHATDTQVFRGEGSSSFGPGFAYEYARADALAQARDEGFEYEQCHVVDTEDWWPIVVYVWLECTR